MDLLLHNNNVAYLLNVDGIKKHCLTLNKFCQNKNTLRFNNQNPGKVLRLTFPIKSLNTWVSPSKKPVRIPIPAVQTNKLRLIIKQHNTTTITGLEVITKSNEGNDEEGKEKKKFSNLDKELCIVHCPLYYCSQPLCVLNF